jgi:hypothetical protein
LLAAVALGARPRRRRKRRKPGVKNPLDSLWGTIICGVILTVIFYYVAETIVKHAAGVSA